MKACGLIETTWKRKTSGRTSCWQASSTVGELKFPSVKTLPTFASCTPPFACGGLGFLGTCPPSQGQNGSSPAGGLEGPWSRCVFQGSIAAAAFGIHGSSTPSTSVTALLPAHETRQPDPTW